MMVGAGVLAAAVAAVLVPMPLALLVAGVAGAAGVGAGVLLMRGGRRAEEDARRAERADDQRRVNEFVRARGTVSTGEVAAALGWTPARAEEALAALAVREHLTMDVDADGRVVWGDPDAARRAFARGSLARVRVAVDDVAGVTEAGSADAGDVEESTESPVVDGALDGEAREAGARRGAVRRGGAT
jgi:hypothetical protein